MLSGQMTALCTRPLAAGEKRQARDNHKKAAEVASTNAAATAATKETTEARSSEMIESQIKAKEATTTIAACSLDKNMAFSFGLVYNPQQERTS